MIYRREEFFEEQPEDQKFPVRQVEQVTSLDGSVKKFVGRVTLGIQTPMGVTSLPVTFEIEAASVQEAFAKFSQRAETEVEAAKAELQDELTEMRRRSQSRIVTPGDLPPTDLGKLKL
ncbi:MAG: hypothetical protein ABSA67_04710 [Candidatus Brocadiia bacterium]|jgi:hypothetical protein